MKHFSLIDYTAPSLFIKILKSKQNSVFCDSFAVTYLAQREGSMEFSNDDEFLSRDIEVYSFFALTLKIFLFESLLPAS